MIWVAWRQQRAQLITLLGLLVIGAIAVVALRSAMSSYLDGHGLASCVAGGVDPNGPCFRAAQEFQEIWFDRMKIGQLLVLALPALVGMFCGAPLFARELEQGTHVLAFTQSVSRTRWMVSKTAVSAGPAIIVLVVLQLLVAGWMSAAGRLGPLATGPYVYSTFGTSSLAPVSYLLFTFALGMFVGVVSRRTLVAMTVTLVAFVVLRALGNSLKEFLVPAQRIVSDDPTVAETADRGALVVQSGFLDAQGAVLPASAADGISACGAKGNAPDVGDLATCYRRQGLAKSYVDLIPSTSATAVHLVEASIFGGLALVLVLATGWALRRQT
jgi:hypothetical protein